MKSSKESYDYLKNSLLPDEKIEYMLGLNPYKRWLFFGTVENSKHTEFNQIFITGYRQGKFDGLIAFANILRNEKEISKEELRRMINGILGREVLRNEI